MLRNLINGVYDNLDGPGPARHFQPGQLASEKEAAEIQLQPGRTSAKPPAPAALPPEVIAARELKVQPRINEVGVETLFGEDLISEKSLDEVILSYLAGENEPR
jgi:hypothetical protein